MTGLFDGKSPATIGASFCKKKIVMDNVTVRLQIWDTAGQERFRSMVSMKGARSQSAVAAKGLVLQS